jgi:hypothetical protein
MKTIIFSLVTNLILATVICVLVISQLSVSNEEHEVTISTGGIDLGSKKVNFTDWELQAWLGIKNRLAVINTDADFPDPNPENRVLGWYSMRNSSSGDYYQKSMEFLLFWEGQGTNGEWEAVASIYNSPDSTTNFVVEVSRFTWHSLNITLDGNVKAFFPQVTNDTISLGYTTFSVSV